jgi:tRNA 2-thiouridine synthesizing protein A
MSASSDEPIRVDGGERRCVEVLLLLSRLIAGQPPGMLVHVTTGDPAASLDLPAWCHLTGHQYLGPLPEQPRPTYAIRVTGNARVTRDNRPWATT